MLLKLVAFLTRANLNYKLIAIYNSFSLSWCLKFLDDLQTMKDDKHNNTFEKLKNKFNNDLDIFRKVKTIGKFKMLAKAML